MMIPRGTGVASPRSEGTPYDVTYGHTRVFLGADHGAILERMQAALTKQGFRILSTIDLQHSLKAAKVGGHVPLSPRGSIGGISGGGRPRWRACLPCLASVCWPNPRVSAMGFALGVWTACCASPCGNHTPFPPSLQGV